MAKLYYNIKSFSRGINNDADPRDIQRDEFAYLKNFSIDSQGQLKSSGSLFGHNFSSLGGAILPSSYYISKKGGAGVLKSTLSGGGGYNLFYFESDHGQTYKYSVTHQTSDGSNADGEITFTNPKTSAASGFEDPSAPPTNTESH